MIKIIGKMHCCRKFLILALMALFACSSHKTDLLRGRVLILGNSITHAGGYVSFIEDELTRQFPDRDFDIVAIGLSGETASGLTEPGSEYPRPCVLDRLDSALSKLKPDVVACCYGMNDGIYAPQSKERMSAYKNGINKLIKKVRAAGANLILLTPPPFDPLGAQYKITCSDSAGYRYGAPYCHYDSVLSDYSEWLMSLSQPGLLTIDFHTGMSNYLKQKRQGDAAFLLSPDGVHPDSVGHLLMARMYLNALGIKTDTTDATITAAQIMATDLFKLVDERRKILSDAWRVEVGHTHHQKFPGLPIQEAKQKAAELRQKIHELFSAQRASEEEK